MRVTLREPFEQWFEQWFVRARVRASPKNGGGLSCKRNSKTQKRKRSLIFQFKPVYGTSTPQLPNNVVSQPAGKAMTNDWVREPPRFSSASHKIKFRSRHCRGIVWPVHDIFFNEILLWLLPTHRTTLAIKYGVVSMLINVLCSFFLWLQTEPPGFSFVCFVVVLWVGIHSVWTWYYWRVLNEIILADRYEWMDPSLPAQSRLPMHAPLRLHSNEHDARRAACIPDLIALNHRGPVTQQLTDNIWRMDSLEWRFCLFYDVRSALKVAVDLERHQELDFRPIEVPANWTLQGVGDNPIYTNQKYPFPCQPPLVPSRNPTGIYRLFPFDVPTVWQENGFDTGSYTILFHGVESAFYVYLNGSFVGFSKDSRLPAEFDITPMLRPTNNTLCVVVVRWSDGSYIEDQDHWWMAGIHRSVEMIRRPRLAAIVDYQVQADASGHLSCHVDVLEGVKEGTISIKLYSDRQVSPDGSLWEEGECIWASSKEVGSAKSFTLSGTILGVSQWSAEQPALYTFTVTLMNSVGVTLQSESCRVGFRTVDIQNGYVTINGERITVCGINRHEHDPDKGKVVSLELMQKDICLMKYVFL